MTYSKIYQRNKQNKPTTYSYEPLPVPESTTINIESQQPTHISTALLNPNQ